jgi:hypothetical protein
LTAASPKLAWLNDCSSRPRSLRSTPKLTTLDSISARPAAAIFVPAPASASWTGTR